MKEIQEQRIRQYFVEACKTLIRGEGIQAVSARTIAEEAGYSYATLYNYFKDIKELVGICVDEFIAEARDYVLTQKITASGRDGIYHKVQCFARYYLQYPGVFHAVFTEDIRELRTPQSFKEKLDAVFEELLAEDFKSLGQSPEKTSMQIELLKLSTYSMLLLYINRRCPPEYKDFTAYFEQTINSIIER